MKGAVPIMKNGVITGMMKVVADGRLREEAALREAALLAGAVLIRLLRDAAVRPVADSAAIRRGNLRAVAVDRAMAAGRDRVAGVRADGDFLTIL